MCSPSRLLPCMRCLLHSSVNHPPGPVRVPTRRLCWGHRDARSPRRGQALVTPPHPAVQFRYPPRWRSPSPGKRLPSLKRPWSSERPASSSSSRLMSGMLKNMDVPTGRDRNQRTSRRANSFSRTFRYHPKFSTVPRQRRKN